MTTKQINHLRYQIHILLLVIAIRAPKAQVGAYHETIASCGFQPVFTEPVGEVEMTTCHHCLLGIRHLVQRHQRKKFYEFNS